MSKDEIQNEINGLKSMLKDTDYTSNKVIESLVATMNGASVTNFIKKFLEWLSSTVTEYGTVMVDRAAWRARIDELEKQLENVAPEVTDVE